MASKQIIEWLSIMASKPDKYGQKYWMAVDVDSKYVVNIFSYLGKNNERPAEERFGDFVVLKLVDPYRNKGSNVTCDNQLSVISSGFNRSRSVRQRNHKKGDRTRRRSLNQKRDRTLFFWQTYNNKSFRQGIYTALVYISQ